MNDQETLDFIHGAGKFSSRAGLENMKILMELLDNPQENLKIIHIAGTNGKGSISSMIHSVLKEQGYKVGLFISPYLEEFTERIQINGKHIPRQDLADIAYRVQQKVEKMVSMGLQHPIEFEIVTAIGLIYFAQQQVDFVVLEVGLGGRLDATNIISASEVSIITAIGVDHRAQLGNTLKEIAGEKAGIIKKNGWVVTSPQRPEVAKVIREKASEESADLLSVEKNAIEILESSLQGQIFSYQGLRLHLPRIEISLLGQHQIYNAATALMAIEVLIEKGYLLSNESVLQGLKKARWPGRFEVISKEPYIILDGAHNVDGAKAFAKAMKNYFPHRKITLMIGILKDKEIEKILREILPLGDKIIAIPIDNPRAISPEELEGIVKKIKSKIKCSSMDSIAQAIQWAKERPSQEVIAFTGSLYMLGEVHKMM
ncbi:bifunctional folylpolyglutamate synthase/dihydrofolate synthase [Irregularibacter muris]|uniref:tetrahydrofolate synthase n=1 Tax=Irregularibacter muris TaxID=1796619 RepID=A0AAE3HIZ2_9FIRM|nr:folylpolyglutamate synthase/dihydrofolate synthase family protein [Irregularibacter muris]MCR1900292.1 bifunctional folylpolyglutamate synthase/dihydrofolate synthase [Irregularibacter muris]